MKLKLAVLAAVALLVPSMSRAAILTGEFTMAGLGDVRVGPNFINWGEAGSDFSTPVGDILFVTASDSFSPLALTQGEIEDLNSASHPVGVGFAEDNFIRPFAQPSWNFTLEFIFPGSGSAAGCTATPGDVCTPFPASPFTIVNLAGGGSSIGMQLRGTVSDGSGDPASAFLGTFTTQFSDLNAAELLALLSTQGFIQSSHSAEFTATATAIPEPATMLLLGTGLLSAGILRRRQPRA